ncbi:MAG: Crp/Fnr family transcriptional regulator [Candidatus Levybacteria bacterium]|nr:Crp/Fnr family transcriptional regulator [Candidatus Levybacteria bacterium]
MEEQVITSLRQFFSSYKTLSYRKRETMLRVDDTPQGVYFITKGFVRFYSLSTEGEELTLLLFKPHDFFPVRWAITGRPLYYSYETMTPVEAIRAPRIAFIDYLKQNPEVLFQITGSILIRLNTTFERMKYLVFGNAYEKVASMFVLCVLHYGKEKGKSVIIEVPLTHQDIATLIGLTRETVSVEIGKLTRKGILTDLGKQFCVNDIEKLKKEARWSTEG